jgi:hypothetical protein
VTSSRSGSLEGSRSQHLWCCLLLLPWLAVLLVVMQLHAVVPQGLTVQQPCWREVPHCQHLMLQT